jgi:hypothetical protein
MQYALSPKEIPLSADEVIFCQGCGRIVAGLRSTRYFDYEPMAEPLIRPRRARDPNQLAKSIIDIATGERPERDPTPEEDGKGLRDAAARAASTTSEHRAKIAKRMAKERSGQHGTRC